MIMSKVAPPTKKHKLEIQYHHSDISILEGGKSRKDRTTLGLMPVSAHSADERIKSLQMSDIP